MKERRRVRPFPFAELPRLTREQVTAGRTLLSHLPIGAGPEWAAVCLALGGPVEITLVEAHAVAASELEEKTRGSVVRLEAAGGRWALAVIDPRLAPRLARRALGTDEEPAGTELGAPRPLTAAEEGAIEFLVAALIDSQPLRVVGALPERDRAAFVARAAQGEPWLYALDAHLDTPVGSGWARLIAPGSLRLAPASARALLGVRDRLASARIPLRVEVARAVLVRAELAGLAPGDVVLFGERASDLRGRPVTLGLGRGGFAARLDGEALTLEGRYRPQAGAPFMTPPTSDEKQTDAASGDALLRELPVEVACELGRVTLSGRELLELRPGAVVPVGRPLAGPVDLTVGGRVVARGELVDIEGELGVRVTQLSD